ncbi:MAG: hypothetical protein GTO18_20650 [Anaerolineales bacterium]|nr:hypothetical protein [Anaerolineales bacterium]
MALVEAGSTIKGLSKTKVFQTYGHREENELKEDFPAILISNLHLNAGSWKDKLKSIDRRAIKAAQDNRVLILRIEDLIFYWYKINYLDGSKEEFLKTLFSESGWLEVKKKDGTIQLH